MVLDSLKAGFSRSTSGWTVRRAGKAGAEPVADPTALPSGPESVKTKTPPGPVANDDNDLQRTSVEFTSISEFDPPETPGTASYRGKMDGPGGQGRKTVDAFAWVCGTCHSECIPVRSESRCLCGHRLKEHDRAATGTSSRCNHTKCTCPNFFFVVAEGSWVLRCRCKHKHIEHDPVSLACVKASCGCKTFDSPWVCNCDHPWSDHKQIIVQREVISVNELMGGLTVEEAVEGPAPEVNNYDGLKRGAH